MDVRICVHHATKAFTRSGAGVGTSRRFQFQFVSEVGRWVEVRDLSRTLEIFYSNLSLNAACHQEHRQVSKPQGGENLEGAMMIITPEKPLGISTSIIQDVTDTYL